MAKSFSGKKLFTLSCLFVSVINAAYAADDSSSAVEVQLDEMIIKGEKPAVPVNAPNTTAGVTAKQIEENINTVTSAGALQYLPSVHVRERYIGDVNGILVMRVNSSTSSAQTTVYADGLLLSNFLNNSFSTAPRWGMVSPNEIDRVDVMYGPFSALYPGNSAGGVVNMSTHMPSKFEAHAKLDIFGERFKEYATDKNYTGVHGSAAIGNKSGKWSWWVNGDHLDNHGHPMTFVATGDPTGTDPVPTPGNTTVVTGAINDIDTANKARIIVAASGADHAVQDNGKIKVAYDVTPAVRASYTLGIWQNTSDKTGESYLRDAAGNVIYGSNTTAADPYKYVSINGVAYKVTAPPNQRGESVHYMHGLSLKSDTGGKWDWEVTASLFNQNKDETRSSSGNAGTTPATDATAGTVTLADGTGWRNIDLRADWRPSGNRNGMHQISFGYHTDSYKLKTDTYNLVSGQNWLTSAASTLSSNSRGKTETTAQYIQDAIQLAPTVKMVAGVRMESWKASEGSNFSGSNVTYPNSSVDAFSPKLSLSYQARPDMALRASYGVGTRFPTVNELFANLSIANNNVALTSVQRAALPAPYSTIRNDANLKPESVNSWELTAEKFLAKGVLRTSLFGENKYDALINQTDSTTLPALGFANHTITSVQNVDKVNTFGFETALELNDLWVSGFDFSGSVTFANSVITDNAKQPKLVGSDQPRIPDWRATLVGTYRPSDKLAYTLSYRFSGRQHNSLINTTTLQYTDPNPDVYGAVSHYSVFDAKVNYRVTKQWMAALGINNLGDFKYYVNPNPYPQRTYYASVKYDY